MASKVTYKIKLDTDGLSRSEKKRVKDEAGEYLVDSILEYVSKGSSPVSGGQYKRSLSKEYKKVKSKISSSGIANMELYGDMLDSLTYKRTRDGVEVGIFDTEQAKKADGHNHSGVFGTSKLPKREFIPKPGQTFKPKINKELNQIIEEAKEE